MSNGSPWPSAQSIRLRAPAEVSPESPAFTAVMGNPSAAAFRVTRTGNACEGSRPRPAVRLVPKNKTRTFDVSALGLFVVSTAAIVIVLGPRAAGALSTFRSELHATTAKVETIQTVFMLIAQQVTREYKSGDQNLTVLRDVSFTVEQGDFVAIVGPSGSGKTTLLGLLAGLDTPTRGKVILDGHDLTTMSENERARLRGEKVGFVFQTFQLIPTLTAQENIQVPLELQGNDGAESRAEDLLEKVGLEARGHHFPTQLSGGEQQRVALARAFANSPRILFADEPTGNLDAATGARVFDLLATLNRESGSTIILVTHDAGLAGRASRVIRLSDGRVVGDSGAKS